MARNNQQRKVKDIYKMTTYEPNYMNEPKSGKVVAKNSGMSSYEKLKKHMGKCH
jgi:hypothetical protein